MFVFSNLAISVDGKIATKSRVHFPIGTPTDRQMMQVLRKRSDAIMMGATTLRAYRGPLLVNGAKKQPINVVLSSKLEGISPRWRFFTEKSTRKILFVSKDAPEARVRLFQSVAEVIRIPSRTGLAKRIIRELSKRGVKRLLVEGGGQLMWDFIDPNCIDELYVTLTPRIIGGISAPSLVDGKGFEPARVINLKLKSLRRIGNELYLVYSKTTRRGP